MVYFPDVLTRLVNGWPHSRIDELMPWFWTSAHRSEDLKPERKGHRAPLMLYHSRWRADTGRAS
ncbi:MAG: transposase domain-containing protein [Acetobacteraceae bacterium]|nr:transposase domain-containing protein [Acetobacteraceae bacterium]